MSDQTPIKTPKQLITVIVLSLIIPIIVILLLVYYVNAGKVEGAGTDAFSDKATEQRIKPVAQINYKDPSAPIVYKTGQEVYTSLCASCHAAGAAGAPKFGDVTQWSSRLGQGLNGLIHSLLNGKGAMQARAGSSPDDYSDYELSRAVVYMTNNSGANFVEPAQPQKKSPAASNQTAIEPVKSNTTNIATTAAIATATMPTATPAVSIETTQSSKAEIGKQIYEQVCIACHGSGVAGAPKFGDKAAWANRISQGVDALYQSALKGKGAMPPRGGFAGTDDELKVAVEYMISAAK
jgi:cytochrome c5